MGIGISNVGGLRMELCRAERQHRHGVHAPATRGNAASSGTVLQIICIISLALF